MVHKWLTVINKWLHDGSRVVDKWFTRLINVNFCGLYNNDLKDGL